MQGSVIAGRPRSRSPRCRRAIRRLHLLIDLRLYRLSFIPALLAVVIAMFSLEGVPDALQPVDPPTTFEGDRAAGVARQIASAAPDRTPGSAGDEAIADLVRSRFDEVPAGAVSEQTLEGTHDGEQVSLRNVLLTLPGEAGETIVVTAGRDSARGAGAATSAAATGILVELANALRVSHEKTYVLASTSGSSSGADGIRALIDNLPERDSIEAVIVISQPGAEDRRPPYVVATSDAETSPNAQLVRTAEGTVGIQAAATTPTEGAFTQLARLAVPSGIGDQAPLIGDGIDAVAISSAGERPLAGEQAEALSGASVDQFGRAIQSAVDALDDAVEDPVHGPGAYLELGENLLPGWALALLAATLILPALVAAVDACARAARRELGIGTAFAWGAARSLPLIGGLAALYALALVGAIPRPPFPFDPGLYELGARAVISFVIIARGRRRHRLVPALAARRAAGSRGRAERTRRARGAVLRPDLARQPLPGAVRRAGGTRLGARLERPSARSAAGLRRSRPGLRAAGRGAARGRGGARARDRRALDLHPDGRRRTDRPADDGRGGVPGRNVDRARCARFSASGLASARGCARVLNRCLVEDPQTTTGAQPAGIGRVSRWTNNRSRPGTGAPI